MPHDGSLLLYRETVTGGNNWCPLLQCCKTCLGQRSPIAKRYKTVAACAPCAILAALFRLRVLVASRLAAQTFFPDSAVLAFLRNKCTTNWLKKKHLTTLEPVLHRFSERRKLPKQILTYTRQTVARFTPRCIPHQHDWRRSHYCNKTPETTLTLNRRHRTEHSNGSHVCRN